MPTGGDGQFLTVIMMIITAVSVTFAIVSRGSGARARLALKMEDDAEALAKDLAAYKVDQARMHAETDGEIKSINASLLEIKCTLARIEDQGRR